MPEITKEEKIRLATIESKGYMTPAIKLLKKFLKQNEHTPQAHR